MSISGVVIAGGKSSRMGEDKALLPFGGYSTLAEFQYRKLETIFNSVYISAKSNKFNFSANIITDKYDSFNPLNAIISALEHTKEDIFLISVDIPFVSVNTINKLLDCYNKNTNYDIYVAKSINGIEPTVAIYRQSVLISAIAMHKSSNFRLMSFIKSHKFKEVEVENLDEFLNINTKLEYKKSLLKVK
jgi:molybdopterin-guanine dinucleotide biosynthesis protein A